MNSTERVAARASQGILFVLLMVLLGIAGLANAATVTIRAGFPQLNGGQAPLWTISEAKLDRQYGIDLRPIYIPGGARLTQTLVSRDVDIALTGGAVINAILSGADLIYVGVAVPTYAFSLYARSDIKEVPDLRGKVLGVITKGASSDHASIALLKQYKMSQGKDLKVLYFSRQQDALAALDKGIVSAAVLSAPTTLMARRLGYKELVNIGSLKLPYTFTGMAVPRPLTRQNPELVKSFLKAYVAALQIVKEKPEVAKQALSRYFGAKDPEIVEEAYRSFAPLFPRIPYVNEDGVRAVLADTDHPKAATADPKDFFDNRFLKDLESSGFVKELYGGR
ncbi:MAG: ABC transporter substrate-binding protein [Deltaproteobacteria bacterium]|nr:ABC transporter substrate-binding protein [Deltaproteobacteria bacterium]